MIKKTQHDDLSREKSPIYSACYLFHSYMQIMDCLFFILISPSNVTDLM